jgi:hypothetical protein
VIKQRFAKSGRRTAGGTEIIWQLSTLSVMQFEIQENATYTNAGYMDRTGPLGKFVENSTEVTSLEMSGSLIKNGTALWLLELQITRGPKI